MSISHSRSVIDSIVAESRAAKSKSVPHVRIRDYVALSNDSARIFAEVTGEARNNELAVSEALSLMLQNRLHSVAGSFCVLAANGISNYVTGIVTATRETVAIDNVESTSSDASGSTNNGFRCLSGNMYIDTEDKLWTLRATDAGKLLIRSDSLDDIEAMEQLMASVSSAAAPGTISPYGDTEVSSREQYEMAISCVEGGDFIDFVCPVSGEVRFGVVVASVVEEETEEDQNTLVVLASDSETSVQVKRQSIVDVHADVSIEDDTAYDSISGSINIESLVEYYRSMFRRNAAYFAEFEKRLRAHLS